MPRNPLSPLVRYLASIDRSAGPDECWPWTKGTTHNGYGRFKCDGKTHRATRWGYFTLIGPIPVGFQVLHRCDNPPCCNPKHWFIGTHADNMIDKKQKDRCRTPTGDKHGSRTKPESVRRGERHYRVKLSDVDIDKMRRLWNDGKVLQRELAERFGVRQSYVSRIVNGARRS